MAYEQEALDWFNKSSETNSTDKNLASNSNEKKKTASSNEKTKTSNSNDKEEPLFHRYALDEFQEGFDFYTKAMKSLLSKSMFLNLKFLDVYN